MAQLTVDVPPPRGAGLRPPVAVAAITSLAAGVVHAGAAVSHSDDRFLLWMFALSAVAQVGWALLVAVRPHPTVLVAGAAFNTGAVVVWLLTRTVGIAPITSLAEAEAVTMPDLTAAAFATASVLAVLFALARPATATAPRLAWGWVGALAIVSLVGSLPAVSAGQSHSHTHAGGAHSHGDGEEHAHEDGEEHEHADGEEHAEGEDHGHADGEEHAEGEDHGHADGEEHADGVAHADGAAHGHEPGEEHADGAHGEGDHGHSDGGGGHGHPDDPDDPHEHPDDPDDPHEHPDDPDDPDDPHEHPDPGEDDPITSIDDPRVTPDQFAIAIDLIVDATNALRPLRTEADLVAAGYVSIGDGGSPGQYEHFIRWEYLTDTYEVDPTHVEAIVMKMNADGSKRVVSAMYMLTSGDTILQAPVLAGELTSWHDHADLCFEGTTRVGVASPTTGCAVGTRVDLPPMLYVWVEATNCGPFSPINEDGSDCGAVGHH